jgi:hypothetical protein
MLVSRNALKVMLHKAKGGGLARKEVCPKGCVIGVRFHGKWSDGMLFGQ